MPEVTVGLPFRDAHGTICDAVRSVLSQSLRDWELIVVDDGSVDRGGDIVWRLRDSRICLIRHQHNVGLASTLNEIAEKAHGRYLCRLDADDLMHPDRLARQKEFLSSNPAIDVVGTEAWIFQGIRVLGHKRSTTGRRGRHIPALLHPTVMGKRDWFREHPYRPAFHPEDVELWARTASSSRFATLPEPLYFYREFDTMSLRKYLRTQLGLLRIYREVMGLGNGALIWQAFLSLGRSSAYALASVLGMMPEFLVAKNQAIDGHERALAESILAMIRRVEFPT